MPPRHLETRTWNERLDDALLLGARPGAARERMDSPSAPTFVAPAPRGTAPPKREPARDASSESGQGGAGQAREAVREHRSATASGRDRPLLTTPMDEILDRARRHDANEPAVGSTNAAELEATRAHERAADAEQRRVDGDRLDRRVPAGERGEHVARQQRLDERVDRIRQERPDPQLDGAALARWREDRRERVTAIRARFWEGNDTYVDEGGRVFAARFDASTGDLELERRDQVSNQPTTEERERMRDSRARLDARLARIERETERAWALVPGGLRRAHEPDVTLDERVEAARTEVMREHYAANPYRLRADGVVERATVDDAGVVTFDEVPQRLDVLERHVIDANGAQVRTHTASGSIAGGVVETTQTERLDPTGMLRLAATQTRREVDDAEQASSTVDRFDERGVLQSRRSTRTRDDGTGGTESARANSTYRDGRLRRTDTTTSSAQAGVDGETTTRHAHSSIRYDSSGRATYLHEQAWVAHRREVDGGETVAEEHALTTIDGDGRPIHRRDGSLAVRPTGSFDRVLTEREFGAGQDEGTDRVTVTTMHATRDERGRLRFDDTAEARQTIEGRDGPTGSTWRVPIDPHTGDVVRAVPSRWRSERQRFVDRIAPVLAPDRVARLMARADELRAADWLVQERTRFDERDTARVVKDVATDVATYGAAVTGAGLLATGVGSGAGAVLMTASGSLGAVATASTVDDYVSGRNHRSGTDVAIASGMLLPSSIAAAARAAAAGTSGARATSVLTRLESGFDRTSRVLTTSYAAHSTSSVAVDAGRGRDVDGWDLLDVVAAWGGAPRPR